VRDRTFTAGRHVVSGKEPPRRSPGRGRTAGARVRRAVVLLLFTVLAPGSAQAVVGPRGPGLIVLRFWLVLWATAALIGLLWFIAPGVIVGLLTSSSVLTLVTLLSYALAVLYVLLLLHAWMLGRPRELPRRARAPIAILTVALMVLTVVPLIGLGRRSWAAADLIAGVFSGERASAAVDGRYNILLLGGDAGPNRFGTRPDSITLVSVDAASGRSVMFSLPRNLENVPFAAGSAAARALPDGFSCGDDCLLNGIYAWGTEHDDLFPGVDDPGAEAMKQAVQGITGLTVNYYVLIDLHGFADLVDALGGIELVVGQAVPIGGGTSSVSGYINPGRQRLDGYHALWFARSREGSSDYARMARQRCVLDAILRQMEPGTVLTNFQSIADAGEQVVSTDIPAAQLPTFIKLAKEARTQKVANIQFVPPLVDPAYPNFTHLRQLIAGALSDEVAAATEGVAPEPAGPAVTAPAGAGSGGSSADGGISAADSSMVTDVSQVCSAR
jgi:polyisoprenyl-teichoic acid--peptidoglycan teichoic acid transferase